MSLKKLLPDAVLVVVLLVVPLGFFAQQTLGGRTMLPVDNLYQFEPYASMAGEVGVDLPPHNALISDLILQNAAWKQFAVEQVQQGEIPLWQSNIAGGGPFLGAGQSSALYPFTLLFLLMPIPAAFGWFTVSQLWLAGVFMLLLARVLGLERGPALISALIYQIGGFTLVSVVFPMIIATMVWLPFLLAMLELTIRQAPALGGQPATLPWVALGAMGLGMAALAGHAEALYFTLLVMAFYAAWRLLAEVIARRADLRAAA
ncbi:MAG: YfhO family protein, partial [Chloroflexi bacterium]|nr:YfhO family protein [Chloroflexota bacterium]